MNPQPLKAPRFIRKTQLAPHEYRKNFHQLDQEVIAAVTSADADRVTPLMSKIYLRLVNAPAEYREREGVLRFEAEEREGKLRTAWSVLCEVVGVASATANKALRWMHDEGIIGYYAGKNGAGIRVFLNRAASSIGMRANQGGQKILAFSPTSRRAPHTSAGEAAFKDSYAVREISDTDINSRAPKNGADTDQVGNKPSAPIAPPTDDPQATEKKGGGVVLAETGAPAAIPVEEIVRRLRSELEPSLNKAAAQAAKFEHERTREWLERHGIPKATRVAQREAYNVLRSHGVINARAGRARADLDVGRNDYVPVARPLSPTEVKEMAEVCIAMIETHGQAIDVTLSEMSAEAGGCLLSEDAPKVRELALSMVNSASQEE